MIPIQFKWPAETSLSGSHYVIARNGIFLRKREWWVDAVVPMPRKSELLREVPGATILLPKLPAEILAKSLRLSKAVYDISESEVCLLLHYSEYGGYQLTVPRQSVSPGGIDYDASTRVGDAICVGTIHSHGKLKAYHSPTDHEDEEHTDGIHITLGSMHCFPKFSLSAEIMVAGTRFTVDSSWFLGLASSGNFHTVDHFVIEQWEVPAIWLRAIDHWNSTKERNSCD